jgi:hypothetical protein
VAADTWGLSWKGTTGSWLASWARNVVPPTPPEIPTVTPAGRKTHRKRYVVEIDGQHFDVDGPEHARALLDRAREVAALHARELADEKVSRETIRRTGKRPIALPTPRIASPNPELREVVRTARKQINALYRSTAIDTELALLMARQLELEDEEEALLLLM